VSTAYRISELFLSLQGEGPSAGTPACFLRLQGCDIGCHWCDTKYSWEQDGGREATGEGIWAEVSALGDAPLLVITGGEPLQHRGIDGLIREALERWPRIEVETSGIEPPPRTHPRLHYNVSPKLSTATPRWADTWRHAGEWVAEPRATFKLVVGGPEDWDEARLRIEEHQLPRERVMLMPEGMTAPALQQRALWLAEVCKREGLRLSPRLHVWMWGARRGT
jgi:7-carboxy-7-deazaguanine synthase